MSSTCGLNEFLSRSRGLFQVLEEHALKFGGEGKGMTLAVKGYDGLMNTPDALLCASRPGGRWKYRWIMSAKTSYHSREDLGQRSASRSRRCVTKSGVCWRRWWWWWWRRRRRWALYSCQCLYRLLLIIYVDYHRPVNWAAGRMVNVFMLPLDNLTSASTPSTEIVTRKVQVEAGKLGKSFKRS